MIRRLLLVVLLVGIVALPALGVPINPPVKFSASKADRTKITGSITAMDEGGFTFTDAKNQSQNVKWDEVDAANTLSIYERVVGKGDAATWIALGKRLMGMKNGKPAAERAFAKALKLDPSRKDEIEKIRRGEATTQPGAGAATSQPGTGAGAGAAGGQTKTGPLIEENNKLAQWPKLSDVEQQDAVKELKAFAEKATQMFPNLAPYETKYFLFYSDLQTSEADKWTSLLDRMYDRLTDTFALPKDENIFRGKALVIVFSQKDSYVKFEKEFFKVDASRWGGLSHLSSNGDVRIAFYRQPNDDDFAHILVHEATHGFVHRYRSPKHPPNWADEGLAEFIAYDLAPQKGISQNDVSRARTELQNRKSFENFFTAKNIENWQYSVAYTMTQMMIQRNRTGYRDYIRAIKDGMKPEEALQKFFGATTQQLGEAYAREMGISGMKFDEGAGEGGIQTSTGGATTQPHGGSGQASGTHISGPGTGSGTGSANQPKTTQRPPPRNGPTSRPTQIHNSGNRSSGGGY